MPFLPNSGSFKGSSGGQKIGDHRQYQSWSGAAPAHGGAEKASVRLIDDLVLGCRREARGGSIKKIGLAGRLAEVV